MMNHYLFTSRHLSHINDEHIFLKHEDLQYITDWMHDEGYNNAAIVGTVMALTPNVKGV